MEAIKVISEKQRYHYHRYIHRPEFFGYDLKTNQSIRRQILDARDIFEKLIDENAVNFHADPSDSSEKLFDLIAAMDELLYPANRQPDEAPTSEEISTAFKAWERGEV